MTLLKTTALAAVVLTLVGAFTPPKPTRVYAVVATPDSPQKITLVTILDEKVVSRKNLPNPDGDWIYQAVADFDGDGNPTGMPDFLVRNPDDSCTIWIYGTGKPHAFKLNSVNIKAYRGSIGCGDFNRDKKMDLLWSVGNKFTGKWSFAYTPLDQKKITIGQMQEISKDKKTFTTTGMFREVGDFDGDGWADDLLIWDEKKDNCFDLYYTRDGRVIEHHRVREPGGKLLPYKFSGFGAAYPTDVNGDGISDIVISSTTKDWIVWIMKPDGIRKEVSKFNFSNAFETQKTTPTIAMGAG
jgi:hypothetical protein